MTNSEIIGVYISQNKNFLLDILTVWENKQNFETAYSHAVKKIPGAWVLKEEDNIFFMLGPGKSRWYESARKHIPWGDVLAELTDLHIIMKWHTMWNFWGSHIFRNNFGKVGHIMKYNWMLSWVVSA